MPASTHSTSPEPQSQPPAFKTITVIPLHPLFAASITGISFNNDLPNAGISPSQFAEIHQAMSHYGLLVFRDTGLDDKGHVEFSRLFGDLDDIRPYLVEGRKPRFDYLELFDAGNLGEDGEVLGKGSRRAEYGKGNGLYHVDSSFNPRRASYSLLKAHTLPPRGTGGNTDFLDTRTAFEDLPSDLKQDLLNNDYVAAHSLFHSRKLGSPTYFADLDPTAHPMHHHKIVQSHEASKRMNLYIGTHIHHIEGLSQTESDKLLAKLMNHCTQEKYGWSLEWENEGDLVIWDNTCVMHRAGGGSFEGKYKRDMRRTTVHDASSTAWGLNGSKDSRPGFSFAG